MRRVFCLAWKYFKVVNRWTHEIYLTRFKTISYALTNNESCVCIDSDVDSGLWVLVIYW